jgi:hypothetical protein
MSCQQCRQPLEEWEAGICEGWGMSRQRGGGNVATVKWSAPYEDVRQCVEYECILSARRWTLKERRTGAVLASYNYLYECYADVERREAARKEWRQENSMTLKEAYDSVNLGEIIASKVIHQYVIECQWESKDKRKGCVDGFVLKSPYPLSDFEVYEKASDAGYRYEQGRVICGCHGDDDD